MNMKLVKYMLIAILVLGTGEVAAQVQVVSGKVTEMLGNQIEPIVGANVNIVNAQNRSVGGAVTNLDGDYRLQIPAQENNLTLVYSYIGMKTKRIKYTGQKVLNVKLESNVETLDEVAITAKRIERNNMGIGHKENVSATQKVMMEDLIATAPIATVEEALQGQLSGVDIALSADPGARSSIRIRGTSTLNGSVEPLIVIDGVPYTQELDDDFDFSTANEEDLGALLNIAPTDIESVEVLKDAAAASIWGARSANGVIVVTTKKGKKDKVQVDVQAFVRIGTNPDLEYIMNQADSRTMVDYEMRAFENNWKMAAWEYAPIFSKIQNSLTLAQELYYANKYQGLSKEEMEQGLERLRNTSNRQQLKDYLMQTQLFLQI